MEYETENYSEFLLYPKIFAFKFQVTLAYKRRVILVPKLPKIATRCRLNVTQNQNWSSVKNLVKLKGVMRYVAKM